MTPECRYCGNAHAVTDLCRPRRVSRRLFLFTASAAAVGAVIVPACDVVPGLYAPFGDVVTVPFTIPQYDALLKQYYAPYIVEAVTAPLPLRVALDEVVIVGRT